MKMSMRMKNWHTGEDYDIQWCPPSHVDESSSSVESLDRDSGENWFHINDDLLGYESNDGDRVQYNSINKGLESKTYKVVEKVNKMKKG